jgi:hypothetical protein
MRDGELSVKIGLEDVIASHEGKIAEASRVLYELIPLFILLSSP